MYFCLFKYFAPMYSLSFFQDEVSVRNKMDGEDTVNLIEETTSQVSYASGFFKTYN